LNTVVIFVFAHKKYSRCFITLRLNHCSHVDYFNNVFTTFLDLECGNFIVDFIKNILICVPKMNEGLTDVE